MIKSDQKNLPVFESKYLKSFDDLVTADQQSINSFGATTELFAGSTIVEIISESVIAESDFGSRVVVT